MAQRFEALDSPDDFPTPPWATRALFEFVLKGSFKRETCLEPACGRGHMANVLQEEFGRVTSADAFFYGFGEVKEFLKGTWPKHDWMVTNPPFRLAEEFVLKGLQCTNRGVAILARTVFLESVGRYENLFAVHPPTYFAQFCERVPMVKGRLDAKATTATGYCWIVWDKKSRQKTQVKWIPKCRKRLERDGDYNITVSKRENSASSWQLDLKL